MNKTLLTLSVAVLSLAAVSANAEGIVKPMDNSKFSASATMHDDILGKQTADPHARTVKAMSNDITDLNAIEPAAGSAEFTMPNSGLGETIKR